MTEPNAAPRSLIWSPLRWLLIGEALVFTVTAQLALSLHLPNDVVPLVDTALWQLAASFGFGFFMTAVLHALGLHAMRTRQSSAQLLLKHIVSGAVAFGLLWLLVAMTAPESIFTGLVAAALAPGYAMLLVWRLFVHMLIDSETMRRNVVVLGAGHDARTFNDAMRRRSDRRGLAI
ncbi:MAG: hypothetical protein KY410_08530, partial [Proteobacteria bacterium]|nr:hypothetical protein [Pseudomonadota bacterium]